MKGQNRLLPTALVLFGGLGGFAGGWMSASTAVLTTGYICWMVTVSAARLDGSVSPVLQAFSRAAHWSENALHPIMALLDLS